jgi:hypothetical protein
MGNELIRPIDPASARAIEETAKATSNAIAAAVKGGNYVGDVIGDLPRDLVGLVGDWVKHKRLRRWAELMEDTQQILRERGVENREEISPSVAVPLIEAAVNEDRDGLKQLWARLLAAAMDPRLSTLVRPSLIELLKNLDPLDARVLELQGQGMAGHGDLADRITAVLKVERDDAFYSLEHLYELKCLERSPIDIPVPNLTAKARLLMRAVA